MWSYVTYHMVRLSATKSVPPSAVTFEKNGYASLNENQDLSMAALTFLSSQRPSGSMGQTGVHKYASSQCSDDRVSLSEGLPRLKSTVRVEESPEILTNDINSLKKSSLNSLVHVWRCDGSKPKTKKALWLKGKNSSWRMSDLGLLVQSSEHELISLQLGTQICGANWSAILYNSSEITVETPILVRSMEFSSVEPSQMWSRLGTPGSVSDLLQS